MMIDTNPLWQRERKRRYALWDLEKLQPGSDRAIQYLAILDEIGVKIEMTPLAMQSPCRLKSYENVSQKPRLRESADSTSSSCLTSTYQPRNDACIPCAADPGRATSRRVHNLYRFRLKQQAISSVG
jgi:hypothetical protein